MKTKAPKPITVQYFGEFDIKDAPLHQLIRLVSEYNASKERKGKKEAVAAVWEIYRRTGTRPPIPDEISEALIEF